LLGPIVGICINLSRSVQPQGVPSFAQFLSTRESSTIEHFESILRLDWTAEKIATAGQDDWRQPQLSDLSAFSDFISTIKSHTQNKQQASTTEDSMIDDENV